MEIRDKFTCPSCGRHVIEEVRVNVTLHNVLDSIEEDGYCKINEEDTGTSSSGQVDRYQCEECGFVPDGVESIEDLYKYLENNFPD